MTFKELKKRVRRILHPKRRGISTGAIKKLCEEYIFPGLMAHCDKIMSEHLKEYHIRGKGFDFVEYLKRSSKQSVTIEGKDFDAAVEKHQEFMTVKSMMETKGITELGEAPLTKTDIYDDIPVIRVSKFPELLLSLGIRIQG